MSVTIVGRFVEVISVWVLRIGLVGIGALVAALELFVEPSALGVLALWSIGLAVCVFYEWTLVGIFSRGNVGVHVDYNLKLF